MDELTREERVALLEKAREVSAVTGIGVERCMVLLENVRHQYKAYQELREKLKATFALYAEALAPSMNALKRLLQDLQDAQGPSLSQPVCPSHGVPMRGGVCMRCVRRQR